MKEIIDELQRLKIAATEKRQLLISLAQKNEVKKNRLVIISGFCSLVSALLMSSVIVDISSSLVINIASAICAFLGGGCALFSSSLFKAQEIKLLQDGASEFLELREAITYVIVTSQNEPEALSQTLKASSEKYQALSYRYVCSVNIYT